MRAKNLLLVAVAAVLAALPTAASAPAKGETYHRIATRYEAVRSALAADSTSGIPTEAAQIRDLAEAAIREAGTEASGAACVSLLTEMREAAGRLAASANPAEARSAFADLSAEMIRYRAMNGDRDSVVVHCDMVKKSWVQPKGEIGNPYTGAAMARCGRVVPDRD